MQQQIDNVRVSLLGGLMKSSVAVLWETEKYIHHTVQWKNIIKIKVHLGSQPVG